MKAFVGHSFDPKDKDVVNEIMTFLPKHGIPCEDAEIAENKDISDKIKKKIARNEIFVGIFTIEQEIKQPNIKEEPRPKSLFQEVRTWGNRKKIQLSLSPLYTTSNWVIQESGYAIGKDKIVILLVERGIYKFPELQGDKEIIPFDRKSFDTALLKLSEIIQDIQTGIRPIEQTISPEIPKQEEPKGDGGEQQEPKRLPWHEMFTAHEKGDITSADGIYQEKIRPHLEGGSVIWDAILYRWKYEKGDANALGLLIKLASETKNYNANKQLALCYEFVGNNDYAREQFLQCIGLTEDIGEKTDCFNRIAISYARDKSYDLAIDKILEVINKPEFKAHLEEVFLKLVEIAEMKEDNNLYIMFAEKALAINPVNTDLRFNLGLKYLRVGKNDLAVYHYKKSLIIGEGSGSLNNIAVGYSRLGMKVKEAYYLEKAISKKDDTLPFANISKKYLDEGFTNIAERLLIEADELSKKGIKVHENIGLRKKDLNKIIEDEDKKDKEIIDLAEKIHKFKVRHVDAYCLKNIEIRYEEISGVWITEKWGEINITFNMTNKTFKGSSELKSEYEPSAFSRAILGQLSGLSINAPSPKQYKIRKVEISGTIYNLSGSYTIKVTEEKETTSPPVASARTLLGSPSADEVYSASGLLIINSSTSIDVLEEDAKNNRFFSHFDKKK